MAEITAALVKELRERTGAGMMDCKKALTETSGDIDKAIDFLREKGLAAAAKKAGRVAAEGLVEAYIHAGGRIGVLVEINCETDFVAKTDAFKNLAKDIAMHIAAANPTYLRRDEVPTNELEHEKEVLSEQARNEGKPEKIIEKILMGGFHWSFTFHQIFARCVISRRTTFPFSRISLLSRYSRRISSCSGVVRCSPSF